MSFGHIVFRVEPVADWQSKCQHVKAKRLRCLQPTGFVTRYSYVTGRAGRVSTSDHWVCEEHARHFAFAHNVPILDAAPGPRRTDAERIG